MRSRDTTSEAHAQQVAVYQAMPPHRRVELAVAMSEAATATAAAGIAARHADYDATDVRMAYLRVVWGDGLFAAVFPGAPLLDP